MKKFYQIVVKWNYTNKIALYEFTTILGFKETIEKLRNFENCTILTTNTYLDD